MDQPATTRRRLPPTRSSSSIEIVGLDTGGGEQSPRPAARNAKSPAIDERPREVVVTEQRFADDRPDADAAEHGDGEVARSLGAPIARRQVGDERGRPDEDGGLADTHQAAQCEQLPELRDLTRGDTARAGHRRAADHQHASAVPIGKAADEGPGADRRQRERGDRHADAELPAANGPSTNSGTIGTSIPM